MKNYLAFAESLAATIEPMRTVVRVAEHPGGGYAVTHEATGAWFRRARHTVTADHVARDAVA